MQSNTCLKEVHQHFESTAIGLAFHLDEGFQDCKTSPTRSTHALSKWVCTKHNLLSISLKKQECGALHYMKTYPFVPMPTTALACCHGRPYLCAYSWHTWHDDLCCSCHSWTQTQLSFHSWETWTEKQNSGITDLEGQATGVRYSC